MVGFDAISSPTGTFGFLSIMAKIGIIDSKLKFLSRLRFVPSLEYEDTMLSPHRPTPTCTRFKSTVEMPCINCGELMRLALIEPCNRSFDLLTYWCLPCDSGESFLNAI
jgi:hypothetical protein